MGVDMQNKLRRLKPVCYWKIKLWSWIWLSLGVGLAGVLATGCAGNAIAPGPAGAQRETQGAVLGSYEVLRYNAEGQADPALNHTLALRSEGDALVISVHDSVLTGNVLLDVRYDSTRVHPVATRFHDLLGTPSQVLSAAFMEQAAGLAGIGACAIGNFTPGALDGDFASVTFAPGALRTASAMGDVYRQPAGVGYLIEPQQLAPGLLNLQVSNISASVRVTWYNAWLRADGTQDGECDIADLTPLGAYFGQVITSANFKCVPSDYSNDGIITYADLVPLSIHFGERCDAYVIEAADNTDGAARTLITTIPYHDSTPKTGAPEYPELKTIYRSWQIELTPDGEYSVWPLAELDQAGNADGMARIYITPLESVMPPASSGTAAYIELPIPVPDTSVTVTGFDIQAVEATGGKGAHSDVFGDGELAITVANQDVTLQLNSISGTWNTAPFAASALPTGMLLADYDEIKERVADALNWACTNGGAAGFRSSGPWYVPQNDKYIGIGDPGAGVVFPDDDPESDATHPEGSAVVTLSAGALQSRNPRLTLSIPDAITCRILFDVTADPLAPANEGYYQDASFTSKISILTTGAGSYTSVYCKLVNWGATGVEMPQTGTDWRVELYLLNYPANYPYQFSWSPYLGYDCPPGSFTLFHYPVPQEHGVLLANIDGVMLSFGGMYALRVFDGTTWSSLNKPADKLVCP